MPKLANTENLTKQSFVNPDHQNEFFEKGYVLIHDCIDEDALDTIGHFFVNNVNLYSSEYFISTIELPFIDHRKDTNAIFKKCFSAISGKYLENYQQFYGGFGVKFSTGETSVLGIHQDTTFVPYDAGRTALTIWIPLIDVDETSGCLYVIPGSHKYNRQPRPTGTSFPYRQHKEVLAKEFLISVPMKRGEIMIMDQSLIHSSGPNNSEYVRVAIMGMYKPAEANLVYYNYVQKENQIEVFDVPDDFYLIHQLGKRPEGVPSKIIPFNDNPYIWF